MMVLLEDNTPGLVFCSHSRQATGRGQPCSCTDDSPAACRLVAAASAARDTGEKAAGDRRPSGMRRDCLHAQDWCQGSPKELLLCRAMADSTHSIEAAESGMLAPTLRAASTAVSLVATMITILTSRLFQAEGFRQDGLLICGI